MKVFGKALETYLVRAAAYVLGHPDEVIAVAKELSALQAAGK